MPAMKGETAMKTVRKNLPWDNLLVREDLATSRQCMERACEASRQHQALLTCAYRSYGRTGPDVQCVGQAHFPAPVKELLYGHAILVAYHEKMAYEARPKGVRKSTIDALGIAVATRDGSGFYGPQPAPEAGV